MRHYWSDDHDATLRAVVEDMLPLRDALTGPREVWWGAVAAETMRRIGSTDIGPNAARSRWEHISRPRRAKVEPEATAALARLEHDAVLLPERDEEGDSWERMARTIEEWERTIGEETRDSVSRIERKLMEMEDRLTTDLVSVVELIREDVAALRREWEGT